MARTWQAAQDGIREHTVETDHGGFELFICLCGQRFFCGPDFPKTHSAPKGCLELLILLFVLGLQACAALPGRSHGFTRRGWYVSGGIQRQELWWVRLRQTSREEQTKQT